MTKSFLENLEWRFATKSFQPDKKLSPEILEKILEAVRMAPSSFGLQPYHIYVISDPEIRQKIRAAAWNQPQITDCSHLLVFCSRSDTAEHRIDEYVETATGGDEEQKKSMEGYAQMMRGSFAGKSSEQQKIWADRQAYIALGFAMAACAELEVDSCPMEGFDPVQVDEILKVPAHMKSVVILATGYRNLDSEHPKVRFPEEDLFTVLD